MRSRTHSILVLLSLAAYLPLLAPMTAWADIPEAPAVEKCCGEAAADARCGEEQNQQQGHSEDCPCPSCPGDSCGVCTFCVKCLTPPVSITARSVAVERHPSEVWLLVPDSPCVRLLRPPQAA